LPRISADGGETVTKTRKVILPKQLTRGCVHTEQASARVGQDERSICSEADEGITKAAVEMRLPKNLARLLLNREHMSSHSNECRIHAGSKRLDALCDKPVRKTAACFIPAHVFGLVPSPPTIPDPIRTFFTFRQSNASISSAMLFVFCRLAVTRFFFAGVFFLALIFFLVAIPNDSSQSGRIRRRIFSTRNEEVLI